MVTRREFFSWLEKYKKNWKARITLDRPSEYSYRWRIGVQVMIPQKGRYNRPSKTLVQPLTEVSAYRHRSRCEKWLAEFEKQD